MSQSFELTIVFWPDVSTAHVLQEAARQEEISSEFGILSQLWRLASLLVSQLSSVCGQSSLMVGWLLSGYRLNCLLR